VARPFTFLSRHRRWILGGWVLLALGGGGLLAARFRIDNSVGVWFPAEDPELRRYEAYLQEFGAWEWTLVLLETGNVDTPRFRADLEALTAKLAGLRHVRRAVSWAGMFPPPVEPGEAMAAGTGLSALLGRPGDTGSTVVLIETANLLMREEPYRLSLVDGIDAAVERYPSIRGHHVAGTSVVNAELNRAARRDMLVFFSLVGMLVTVLSLLLLRSWRDTAVLLAVAFSSAGTTLGLIVLCGYSLNMITIMLPTVLIALSVADVVHLLQAFHQERGGAGLHQALDRVVRDLWLPCLGTTLTTVGGFLSLAGSSMLPIFQLAVFSAAGLLLTWLFTMGVAPLLLERLWRNAPPRARKPFRAFKALAGWEARLGRGWKWVVVGGALASLMLFGLPRLRTDTDYVRFFRSGARLPAAYEAISAAGYPQTPLSLVLEAPAGSSFEDPAYRSAAETFGAVLLEGGDERLILSPFPGGQSREGGAPAGGRTKQLTLLTRFLSGGETGRLLEEVRAAATRTLPAGVELTITGSPVLWSRMDAHLVTTQRSSVIVVSVVTFLVLLAVFRSVPLALLGWATSFLPVVFILGFMGFLGVSLNLATVLIAGISLGLAVDDTIHFVHGYQTNRRRGAPPREAVAATLIDVGTRMILTSLILAGSFACMVASDFLPSANFGAFTACTLLVALVADLTLLPLVLARGPELREAVRRRMARTAERVRILAGRPGTGEIERG
jgi:predicted RND superfamily exporter protein